MDYQVEEHKMSVSDRCAAIGKSRAVWYEQPKGMGERDAPVIDTRNEVMNSNIRWGFWKSFKYIRRKGKIWNNKRAYRVNCLLGLNHKRRGKKRLPKKCSSLWRFLRGRIRYGQQTL